jgi:hypothetical protein
VAQANAQNPLNITLKSQNGFTGVVLLETVPSSMVSTRFSPDTIPLARISNSTLWIDPLSAGNRTVTVVASSLGVSHSIQVSIIAEDLQMAFNPPSLTLARNTSANVTMTLSSLNGLTAYLYLQNWQAPQQVYMSESPYRLFLPRGGSVATIMTVSASTYATTGSFPVEAQICPADSCFGTIPSPPGPFWTFRQSYNLTII